MRIAMSGPVVAVLALLGACGTSAALADPPAVTTTPAAPAVTTTPAPAASVPATTPAVDSPATPIAGPNAASDGIAKPEARASSDEAAAAEEKRLRAAGYRPETRNGVKVWCRREGELGSRLGGIKVCGTPDEMQLSVHEHQESVKQMQKTFNPSAK